MTLPINHHSVPGDWNFSAAHWALDPSIFVSPPSSLRFDKATTEQIATIKASVSGIVKQGQLITQLRRDNPMNLGLVFRAQNPASSRSCYLCHYWDSDSKWYLSYVNAAGIRTHIGASFRVTLSHNTWYKYRLTFWEAYNYQNIVSLAVRLELLVNGVWTEITTWYDPNNSHASSQTNLVGLFKAGNIALMYFDDTELWVPAA